MNNGKRYRHWVSMWWICEVNVLCLYNRKMLKIYKVEVFYGPLTFVLFSQFFCTKPNVHHCLKVLCFLCILYEYGMNSVNVQKVHYVVKGLDTLAMETETLFYFFISILQTWTRCKWGGCSSIEEPCLVGGISYNVWVYRDQT